MAKAGGSVEDGLSKIYADLASLQLLPDAASWAQDLAQLQQAIQQSIQQHKQQAQQAAAQAAQGLAGGQVPGGAPGGGGPPGPPPGPLQTQPGGGGGAQPFPVNMPNPDELRRVLAGSSMGANGG